jgi:hypothetical protein
MRLSAAVEVTLRVAAAAHDRAPCAVTSCERCAVRRERCSLCALPSCGVRSRAQHGPAAAELQKCSACLRAAYCGAAHQREHWPAHKGACRAARAAAAAAEAGGAS